LLASNPARILNQKTPDLETKIRFWLNRNRKETLSARPVLLDSKLSFASLSPLSD
jgi:hypothetical protein